MKLTIGLTAEADGEAWPAADIRNVYGHRLATLRPDVDRALGERMVRAAAPPYIQGLVRRVADDPYLPLIFEALAEWSESTGRYRDLNILGGWRYEQFGKDALDLVEGRLAFAIENGKLKMSRIHQEEPVDA